MRRYGSDIHSWIHYPWKPLPNCLTCDKNRCHAHTLFISPVGLLWINEFSKHLKTVPYHYHHDVNYTSAEGTVYPKKYAHGFCFAVLCCGYTLTDFPISIRLTSLALWQSNNCPSASKATLMNMDKYFMWIHYERLHNHNKAKHNKTVCIFLGIYCIHSFNSFHHVTYGILKQLSGDIVLNDICQKHNVIYI